MTTLHTLYPADLLTARQAAARAGVALSTIWSWQHRGILAVAIPAGPGARANLYAAPDVDRVAAEMAARAAA